MNTSKIKKTQQKQDNIWLELLGSILFLIGSMLLFFTIITIFN